MMVFSEREKLILGAIIDHYLSTGESVGSRTIVKKYNIDLSPATIRNVMADLEDEGYITKRRKRSGEERRSKRRVRRIRQEFSYQERTCYSCHRRRASRGTGT